MEKCDLLIRNVALLNKDYEIEEHVDIAIVGNRIAGIGNFRDVRYEEVIEGDKLLAMPGLVDGHIHNAQQLLRGKPIDEFPMVWTRFLVPFESNLTEEDMYISAQLCALEMIKSGTTMYADAGGPHMEMVAKVCQESGMRGVIARSTMDMGAAITDRMKYTAEENIAMTEELVKKYHNTADERVKIAFGIRQVMTCSQDLLKMTAQKAKEYDTMIHCHLCEHKDEVNFCLSNYQLRPAELLEATGVLGPNLISAHNVALSDPDIDLLAKRHVGVIHCPRSNLQSHGFPKAPRILQAGLSIGIGSDGACGSSLSIFDEIKVMRSGMIAYWGLPTHDPMVMPVKSLLRMMSQGGADALNQGDVLGTIEEGKKADIILLNLEQPHLVPSFNLPATIVECANSSDVVHSIINGKIVMKDRHVLTLNEEEILSNAKKAMKDIAVRAGF